MPRRPRSARLIAPNAPPGAPPGAAVPRVSVAAMRDLLHAVRRADDPEAVLQYALDRTGPALGATFASVYVAEPGGDLLRLAAAWQWPAQWRRWLADVRVRVGVGPSGEAVSDGRMIEVADVHADPRLRDWQDVARELGFVGLAAVPIESAEGPVGAVTFYFGERDGLDAERRGLARLVADVLAVAIDKAALLADWRRAEAALAELRDARGTGVPSGAAPSRHPTPAYAPLPAIEPGDLAFTVRDAAASVLPADTAGVAFVDDIPEAACPVRTDHELVARIVRRLVHNAWRFTTQGEVRVALERTAHWVRIGVHDTGLGMSREQAAAVFDRGVPADDRRPGLPLPLAQLAAVRLGGDLTVRADAGAGSSFLLDLPLEPPSAG